MSDWQPIETAPMDGTAILGWPVIAAWHAQPDEVISYVVRWCDRTELWREAAGEEYEFYRITHWMPLPEPPGETKK